MRILKICALTALMASVTTFGSIASAQSPAPQGTRVGVIDVGYIFKNHPTMKTQIDNIDKQIKQAEDEINARRESVLKEIDKLRSFKEDTMEYKQAEEKIANLESQLKLDFMRREKEFAEAKATIIYDAYQQVTGAVKAMAEHNGIDIVLRFSQDEMDPKKPQSVGGGINRDIVYFNPSMDLTTFVLKLLPQAQTASAPAAPRR